MLVNFIIKISEKKAADREISCFLFSLFYHQLYIRFSYFLSSQQAMVTSSAFH